MSLIVNGTTIDSIIVNNTSLDKVICNNVVVWESGPKIVSWTDGTVDEISAMLKAHYAGTIDIADYWSVGDSRRITGSDGTTATWVIIGIKHDDLADGSGKAAVTIWKSDNWTRSVMNSSYGLIISADYATSQGRTTVIALKTNLDSGLQSLVKSVTKLSAYPTDSNNTQALKTSTEDMFLLSNYEIFGTTYKSYVTVQDGTQYAYMVDNIPESDTLWSRSGFWKNSLGGACFVMCDYGSQDGFSCNTIEMLAPACCL